MEETKQETKIPEIKMLAINQTMFDWFFGKNATDRTRAGALSAIYMHVSSIEGYLGETSPDDDALGRRLVFCERELTQEELAPYPDFNNLAGKKTPLLAVRNGARDIAVYLFGMDRGGDTWGIIMSGQK